MSFDGNVVSLCSGRQVLPKELGHKRGKMRAGKKLIRKVTIIDSETTMGTGAGENR
jgi:hypothetical protein